ncbi:MAG: hypothetical protein ABEJ64_04035 [Candidatus Nanohaloarchaea archaeon]
MTDAGKEAQDIRVVASSSIYQGLRSVQAGASSEVEDKLVEEGLVERSGGEPEVVHAALEDMWFELWEQEAEEELRVPENFSDFLRGYVSSYLETQSHSNIYRMLKPDFLHGLILASQRNETSPDLEELEHQLKDGFSKNHYVADHVIEGVREAKRS